ncbi:hypothetical protein GQ457_03G002140 [Hibiscus cannabinus]
MISSCKTKASTNPTDKNREHVGGGECSERSCHGLCQRRQQENIYDCNFLNHPYFQELLNQAKEKFGLNYYRCCSVG